MKDKITDEEAFVESFNHFMRSEIRMRAKNIIRKYRLQERRNAGLPLDELDLEDYREDVGEEETEKKYTIHVQDISIDIDRDDLFEVLNGLSQKEKEALLLNVGCDFPLREVAKRMGISYGRARNYKSEAIRKARKIGEQKDDQEQQNHSLDD